MKNLYERFSVQQLIDKVQKMNIEGDEDRRRLFTFFSANVLHFMPHIDVDTHEANFKEVCLHQHLSWKDQFDPQLYERVGIKGWHEDLIEDFRSSPGIICTYHTGSYRLINRLLAEATIPFSLVVNTEVFKEEAANFKTAFDRCNSSSLTFDLIDAEHPSAMLKMMRALKSGKNLLVYVDGNTGTGKNTTNNLTVDFMGGQLSVRKGMAVLASILKCPIYPVSCIRSAADSVHFKMHDSISQLEGVDRESFVQNTMQQLYRNLASTLKKNPFQWECWLYLHQHLVLPKTDIPPSSVKLRDLTDARLWASFKINERCFALHKPSFSSFEISGLTCKRMRKALGYS